MKAWISVQSGKKTFFQPFTLSNLGMKHKNLNTKNTTKKKKTWLVVEPTQSEKYANVKMGSSFTSSGKNQKTIFETTIHKI